MNEATKREETARPKRLSGLREVLWLDQRLMAAKQQALNEEFDKELALARAALSHADLLLASQPTPNPALILYRAAVQLMIRAELSRATATDAPSNDQWHALLELLEKRTIKPELSESESELAELALSVDGDSRLARLSPEQARTAARVLRRIAVFLEEPLAKSANRVRAVLRSRWLRVIGALVAFGCVCAATTIALTFRPNLALHRPVSVPNADSGYADTSRLVDGNRTDMAFHATGGPHTATIDLGQVKLISRVVVVNRGDCCEERAVPLLVELAQENEFQTVAERKTIFREWRADFPPTFARYVRLHSKNSEPFHLSEVEVY